MNDEKLIERLRHYAQIAHTAASWGFAGEGEVMNQAADRIYNLGLLHDMAEARAEAAEAREERLRGAIRELKRCWYQGDLTENDFRAAPDLKRIGTGLYETQSDYRLAPHLQRIVDAAKSAPQWDTQADRLAPTDAAQAREAALMEAHKAILAMDTKKDEDWSYNLAVLRAAEKVRRLISEART